MSTIGTLRNHDGDTDDIVDLKMNLYFTKESRNYPYLFSAVVV